MKVGKIANPGALTPRGFRLMIEAVGRLEREETVARAYMLRMTRDDIKPEAFDRYLNRLKREPKDDE
jgi:hypothetical protein